MYLFHHLFIGEPLYPFLFSTTNHCLLSRSLSLSLCLCVCVCPSACASLSLCLCVCLSLTVCVYLSLSLPLYLSLSLSLSLSLCLPPSSPPSWYVVVTENFSCYEKKSKHENMFYLNLVNVQMEAEI